MTETSPTGVIESALEGFDREVATSWAAEAERERAEMLERFSLASWPEMALPLYAIGHDDDVLNAYCRWVEFDTPHLGSIRGGSARKLIIYKRRDKPGWYFDAKSFATVEVAWEAVRQGFVDAFALANDGRWEEIDSLPVLKPGPALLLKSLHIYFPEEILPVCSQAHLRHFLSALDNPAAGDNSLGPVALNRALLQALRSAQPLAKWPTNELERLLYLRFPRLGHRFVKIAPGEQARFWEDCRSGGYICVGWDEIGDLAMFESKEDFQEAFIDLYLDRYNGHRNVAVKKANEVWTLKELEPGDLVVANRGTTEVLALGTVVEPGYAWRDSRPEHRHTVAVDWDTSFAKTIPAEKRWGVVTVESVPERLRPVILRKGASTEVEVAGIADSILEEIATVLESKGQVILYGPPGTGKTYQARRFAVWWLRKRRGENDPASVLGDQAMFDQAEKELGRTASARNVWWVVADPAQWSWSQLFEDGHVDFDRGRLQKNFAVAQPGDLVIGYESTPSKRIAALARVSKAFGAEGDQEPKLSLEPVTLVANGLSWTDVSSDSLLAQSEPVRMRNYGTLFALSDTEAAHLISMLAERNPDVANLLAGTDPGDGVADLTRVTFHPSYSYEDFVEALRPVSAGAGGGFTLEIDAGVFKRVCGEARANPERTYLVLIDEFNRANVARVFGELITLIERDKRGLEIVLPQSKEVFSVPTNVFLLGTMNTADRSIRLLDAALRRRFGFVELMPRIDLLEGEQVGNLKLDEFLGALNERIAKTYGREKQIGHSFFLDDGKPIADADVFARVFRHEIVPLLQEYCYDDYGQLVGLLGDGLVDADALRLKDDVLADTDRLLAALESKFQSA